MEDSKSQVLIGRAPQLETIRVRLADPTNRVLTLRGPGGVGKTTLARNIAAERRAPFVELDLCSNADDIASAFGEALGLPDVLRNFGGVIQHLSDAEVSLVIFDNAEHITEFVHQSISGWLEGTGVCFLVTSRERTGVDNESIVDVMPLENDDALELFELRAQEASRRFVLDDSNREDAKRLIDLVDGLPLAIELAAARMKILTPAQVCDRLGEQFELLRNKGDVVDRHATLDACVEWSWNLLTEQMREALRQVSIFRGSFTIDEAEAVVASSGWVGDDIEELVERSLIWVERSDDLLKFSLYDGVRRFVDRRCSVDPALIERYALFLRDRVLGQILVHRDLTNILHAFDLCIDDRPDIAVELLVEARQKLWRSGFLARVFEMLDRALAVPDLDPMWRAGAQAALASSHYGLMEYSRQMEALDAAEALIEGDDRPYARRTRAHVALLRGVRADEEHHLDEADVFYAQAKEHLDVLPPAQKAHLLAACGLASLRRGRLEQAISEHEESIDAARRSPDSVLLARTLSWSSNGYIASRQLERAISRLEEALEIYEDHEDVISRAVAEYALAQALIDTDIGRAKVMAEIAMESAKVGRLRVLEAMTKVLVARLHPSDESASTIRRAMRVFGEDSSHNDRWSAWVSLLVVLVRQGELDAAAQEASFLVTAATRVATDQEQHWCRRYLAAIHATREDREEMYASIEDAPFTEALERALQRGEVSEVDSKTFSDPYLRFIHDNSPLHLDLLQEVLSGRTDRRELRLLDDGNIAILPDETQIELESRYVLKRLLLAMCASQEESPGVSMTLEDLVEAGWPDEQMTYESGIRRVYSAIRNLRKLGLEEIVLTGENGYLIDPDLRIVRE